jgi:hypothetical protein
VMGKLCKFYSSFNPLKISPTYVPFSLLVSESSFCL